MKISVITPYYENFEQALRCLQSTLKQDYSDFEIIAVDDGSSHGGANFALGDPRLVLVRAELNRGPAAARNLGVAKATGDLLVFLDADSVVDDTQWLQRHAEAHRRAGANVIVGGGIEGFGRGLVAKADAYCHWFTNIPRRQSWHGGETNFEFRETLRLVTNNMSLRRETFERVGKLDETLRTGEDGDFCARATTLAIPLRLVPSIVVRHEDRERLRDFYRCFYRVGWDRIPLYQKNRFKYWWILPRNRLQWALFVLWAPWLLALQTTLSWLPYDRRVLVYFPLISIAYFAMAQGIYGYLAAQANSEGAR